jgi:hypothetical protein
MKLEYLADGSTDCPLIRLYEFEPSEASQLRASFALLADATRTELQLNELPYIQSLAHCALRLHVAKQHTGISQVGPSAFHCALTTEGWREVTDKVDPFTVPVVGECFQWLNEDGDVSLLLSPTGRW